MTELVQPATPLELLPVNLTVMSKHLALAKNNWERIDIRDHAQKLQAAYAIVNNKQMEVEASWLVADAERCIVQNTPKKQTGPKPDNLLPQGNKLFDLEDTEPEQVVKPDVLSKMRKAHEAIDDEQYEELKAAAIADDTNATRGLIASKSSVPHRSQATGNEEWYTPTNILEAAKAVMGSIHLDPASNEVAQRNVQAATYYTKEQNGLDKSWFGNVWLNPPYTRGVVDLFVHKFCTEDFEQGLILVNNCTETSWGQELLSNSSQVCFLAKRVRFLDAHNNLIEGSGLQGQMLCGIGTNLESFTEHFSKLGVVFS